MARAQYFVVQQNGKWVIKLGDKHYGPYGSGTQREAIKVAVDAANASGKDGFDAQVLVHGADGKFRTEWTYGNDPYPPKG
ncbi:DUF2188 domain-containing protein [Microvirga terrestris]|uniref:DUF2188 domain-containing protein n=1 Tax=Microvirga terrestris TaxID=2791024 RepID=A0ABS0HTS8_9HYPH|nr:DUF2188 domain-containing protein [Microvirga terrestris]MBF9196666.1 DUF2188 domain-containing protein [Microvirga terrestris]